jgi:hypothetical protein
MAADASDTRPVPDPTLLTTQQLIREIGALRDLFTVELTAARELTDERFAAVQMQFRERDVRNEHAVASTKVSVDTALQAAKEAVGAQNLASAQAIAKAEAATTKQIDALATLISAQAKATDEKIDDVKSRITAIESQKIGVQEQRGVSKDVFGYIVGAVGLLVGVLSVIGFVLSKG